MGNSGQGPIGGSTNTPDIDPGTTNRQRNTPPKSVGSSCADDAYVYGLASTMRAGIWVAEDKFADQILDRWLKGQTSEVTFEDEAWGKYMRAHKGLKKQIHDALAVHAERIRPQVDRSAGTYGECFTHRFHAEVGGKYGGYFTAYQLLHGSNKNVGDCEIQGTLSALRSGQAGSAYTVTYEELQFIFHDIVDIFPDYALDVALARFTTGLAHCLYGRRPKDYILHVKWKADDTVKIEVAASFDAQT